MLTSDRTRAPSAAPASQASPRGPGGWALFALYAACLAVLLTNAGIYLPPAGHRFVDMLKPGAADLLPSINAAYALAHGENPYHAQTLLVPDPYDYSRGSYEGVTYLYPPSHALLYVPMTWLMRGDYDVAIRLQFLSSVLCVALLSWLVLRLLRSFVPLEAAQAQSLWPALVLALGLNVGNMLGFERGQSDVITSAFAWLCVLFFLRRRYTEAAFLAVAATLLKGYGILLAGGVLLLGLRQSARRTLAGATAALILLLLPVARYLPDAIETFRIRSAMFWSGWTNQGFANLAYSLRLQRDYGRIGFTALGLASTLVAWLQLWRVMQADVAQSADPQLLAQRERRSCLWLVAFATAALSTVVGYSLNSIAYDVVIVMPGALVLALGQRELFPALTGTRRALLGALLSLAMFGLFVFDLGTAVGSRLLVLHIPLAAGAQVVLLSLIIVSAGVALRRPAR